MATRPTSPSVEKVFTSWVMLPMMLVEDKNGMLCPLNNTSSTIPRASRVTPRSARFDAHAFTLFKYSI